MKTMKKVLSVILVAVMLLTAAPLQGFANVDLASFFAEEASAAKTTSLAVGNIVEFGSYPQTEVTDSAYEGKTIEYNNKIFAVEPIKWRVLRIVDEKALLISEEIIDNRQYNSTSATVNGYYGNNYAHSSIREWLINDFYNTSFSSSEQNCIVATTLDNSAAPTSVNASGSYTQYSSESTTDKVFLLSKDEANTYASRYFGTTGTDYAYANGMTLGAGAGSGNGVYWLLRTAGNNTFQIYYVHMRWGDYVTYFNWDGDGVLWPMGIRPAIYVDLEKLEYLNKELPTISDNDAVVSYEKLEFIENAKVTHGDTTKIEAGGYYTAEFNDQLRTDLGTIVYAAVPESTGSHISAVHCNGADALVEADYVQFPISGDSEEDKNRLITINVYTDLENPQKFQLLYDGIVLDESETGEFCIKAKDIPGDHHLKVRVIDNDGTKYNKIETNIRVYTTTTTFKLADNKISISFPEELKLIGGWNFDIDMSSLPFFVLKDEDTIRIGVGASENSKWSKLNGLEDSTSYWDKDGTKRALWTDWKIAIKEMKQSVLANTTATMLGQKATSFSSFGCNLAASGEISPIKIDAKAAFYLELKYNDGKWESFGADGFISISASLSGSAVVFVFALPIEFTITGKVGATADVSILYNPEKATWDYSGVLDLTLPSVTGSATIGIPKVFNGGGYVQLTNKLKLTMFNNITGTLSGELGAQGRFVVFSGKKTLWKFLDWEYMNKNISSEQASSGGGGSSGGTGSSSSFSLRKTYTPTQLSDDIEKTVSETYKTESYSLDSRNYLNYQSDWYGEYGTISLFNAGTEETSAKLLQESIYDAANPKIINTDNGVTMMIWTADIPERSLGNQTAVVYSVYDSSLATWSEPIIVCDDGTADSYPDITTDGTDIYITWVNAKKTFDETVTMEEFSSACEICVATYNANSNQFENVQSITNNEIFDLMPSIYADNGSVYVAYLQNTDNAPLTLTGTNTVTVANVTDAAMPIVMLNSIDNPVESIDISNMNGQLTVAYTVDTDGNIQTTEDIEIYLLDEANSVVQYTTNNFYERGIQFAEIEKENVLAYFAENGIHYTADLLTETIISIENGVNVSPEFVFVDDAAGTVLLTKTTMSASDKTNIYANVLIDGTWMGDAKITDCSDDDLKSFSACKDTQGNIQLVYTTAQYEEDMMENNNDGSYVGSYNEIVNLYSSEYSRTTDISLESVDFDNSAVIPGEILPIYLTIKNNGLVSVSSINVTSALGTIETSEDIVFTLQPGQTETIVYDILVSEELTTLTDLTFSVLCQNDANSENNTICSQIGYTDLSLLIDRQVSAGNTSAIISVKNNSCIATDAVISLYKNSYDSDLITEYSILNLAPFSVTTLQLSADAIAEHFTFGDTVCMVITATEPEISTADNRQFFTVSGPQEKELYSYTILNNDEIQIDAYNGDEKNVIIPSTYDEYTVTAISNNAIPDSVESVFIPDTVNSIGNKTFYNASSLKEISVAPENTNYCSIDDVLYSYDLSRLVRYPSAKNATDFTIPEEVTTVTAYAFYDCDFIESITISENVESMGNCAISDCDNLQTVYYNAVDCSVQTSSLIASFYATFKYSDNIETVVIGDQVQYIPGYLFYDCSDLKEVIFGENPSLLEIGTRAFYYCSDLENFEIPDTVEWIGSSAFSNCRKLTSITIPEGVSTINSSTFNGCSSLSSITLPETITSIGSSAFYNCSALESLSVPETVTNIGSSAFYNCKNLTTVNIPENISSINASTFYGCSSLEDITIPAAVTSIGDSAFAGCSVLSGIELPENLTSIGTSAFAECSSLTSIVIPETVTSISDNTFANCTALEKIEIPYQTITIGETPFNGCSKVVIWCHNNSVAYEYAIANSIKYKLMEFDADDLVVTGLEDAFIDGLQYQLSAEISPIYTEEKIVWSSSNSEVFTVSNTGLITAKGPGEAILTIASSRGSVSKTFDINVLGLVKDSENTNLYHVKNADDMLILSAMVNGGVSFAGKTIQLDSDIDLSNIAWTPIGNSSMPFSGVFDGQNHKITNLYHFSSNLNHAGLFGYIKTGGVKDLVVEGTVTGCNRVGLLAGTILDSALYNCKTIGDVKRTGADCYYGYVGGLVGSALHSVIINCAAETDVTADFDSLNYATIGGLVGTATAAGNEPMCILNSYAIGDIQVSGNFSDYYVGGIAGYLEDDAVNNYYYGEIIDTDIDSVKNIGYAFGYVVSEFTSESSYNGIGTIIVENNYYSAEQKAIGLVSDEVDTSGWTVAFSEEDLSTIVGENALVTQLNANKDAVEEIITIHRDILFESTWSELAERIGGETFTVSQWRMGTDNHPVNYGNQCFVHAESEWVIDTAATCTQTGTKHTYCLICNETIASETIPALNHREEIIPALDSTCTTTGLTEGKKCTVCGTVTVEQTVVPSLGHSEEILPALNPTCTTTGLTEGKKCTVCGVVTVEQSETPALGHAYDNGVITKAATCTATGVKTFTCAHDASHTYTETIAKTEHKKVTVNKQEATATEDGYTGDVVCSVCGTVITVGKVIPATGEETNTCDHICHQDGIMGFIWKIVQFFWKLFKMNPICECGVAHY